MCRREAIHHRLCGHVLVHRKRCTLILNSRTPQKWCYPFKQREECHYCKRCRRERDDRAAGEEGRKELDERRKAYKADRRASQNERWRRDEGMDLKVPWARMQRNEFRGRGVRVPDGRLEWHYSKTRGFFGKIKNLFTGKKRDKELLFRNERDARVERYYDRDGRHEDYYYGEDDVSQPRSPTVLTCKTNVAIAGCE